MKFERVRLTKAEQLALCKHRRTQAPHATLQELCNWTAAAFKLPQPPSKTWVSRTLRREAALQRLDCNALQRARVQQAHVTALDSLLLEAIAFFEDGNVALNGRIIMWLAKECADRIGIPAAQRPRFTRSGWLRHFLKRHGIRSRRAYGESDSVDLPAARAAAAELRTTLSAYHPEDVYNMDESGFFYQALVRRSLSINAAPALKLKKARVTLVIAANATGTHELPIMVLGRSKKPRWLSRKPDGIEYTGTPRGWMTTVTFHHWLQQLNQQMAEAGCKILLLVDNAPSHKVPDIEMEHVRVVFLPPNTTAAIQPMDQGVIATLKAQILDKQTAAIMQRFMNGETDAHAIDIAEALSWCKDTWDAMPSIVIQHCWQHAGLYVDRSRIADILNP